MTKREGGKRLGIGGQGRPQEHFVTSEPPKVRKPKTREPLSYLKDTEELADILETAGPSKNIVQPVVDYLPPNWRLVMCTVGPHSRVRVMVRPNNKNYIPKMVIPLDVDLTHFDPNELLIFNGDPPRRKGNW